MTLYNFIRPFLFQLDPETAHRMSLKALDGLPAFLFNKPKNPKPLSAMGIDFPHCVGLAAGFDKNGEHLDALAKLGFAFIEVGTVTPRAQSGNPKPRLFRLPSASAIINRMGFNNAGVDALVANILQSQYKGVLGINIGKNKDTPLEQAVEDYLCCLRKVYQYASYVTVNISSPNTPGLRQLQQKEHLDGLLKALCEEKKRLADNHQRSLPLLLKISPDESKETVQAIAQMALKHDFSGIIATNTTASRTEVSHLPFGQEEGGLSGRPVFRLATDCLRLLKEEVGDALTLVGVGGIEDAAGAKEKLDAGATLLQVYTGFIYKGPDLVVNLVDGVAR
jgi:dihydroorotate dehydrogenase